MDKKEIKDLINNLIEEKNYDKRIIPYITEFFAYNAKQFGWNEETINKKVELLKQRINGIEFVSLGDKLVHTDFNSGNILINETIKRKDISPKELLELISQTFQRLELATKDEEVDIEYWHNNSLKQLETLKYSLNSRDKHTIIKFISNAFNIETKDIYDIIDVWKNKVDNIDKQNKAQKDFVEDSFGTLLPGIAQATDKIMDTTNFKEKSDEYIKLYAISILAIKYRIADQTEDKEVLRSQYEKINEEFSQLVEEYVITADRLENMELGENWKINFNTINEKLQQEFKGIKPREKQEETELDDFRGNIDKAFVKEAQTIKEEQKLEESYAEEQVNQIITNYPEKFRPIIQEYFKRSIKVYDWSKDEFDKKIKNYQIGIKNIRFTKKEFLQKQSIAAYWTRSDIEINDDLYFVEDKSLLSTFFHEEEHATDNTTRVNKVLENGLISKESKEINEYATEIGATHLVGDKMYDDKLCFTHSMDGYDECKYAGSMMSAALGISEFEFAKLRNKGELAFKQELETRFNYLDIKAQMQEFNNILGRITNAPRIINMKKMSEAYADMYNLSSRIIKARIEHEGEKDSQIKTKYEMSKIANNMKQAKKKLHLRNKFIKPIIEDYTIIENYTNVTTEDRKRYLSLVEELYPEKNVKFDNKEILRHINKEFKHPIRRKVVGLFRKKEVPLLSEASEVERPKNDESARAKHKNLQEELRKNITKMPTIEAIEQGKTKEEIQVDSEIEKND